MPEERDRARAKRNCRLGGLIAAVQNGISKKNSKPYAMLTLEDLAGSVQVLCMNENYDKYRPLFELNKAIMVVGEVSGGDDKPKIFPQEIFPLEDAPRKYIRQVHVRASASRLGSDALAALQQLVTTHKGQCPLFLCVEMPGGELVFIETHERFRVLPSLAFQREVEALFGDGSYYAKVDTSLPERAQRRWERREDDGNNGD